MRTIASLVTTALAVATLGACGLSVSGIADTSSDGGPRGDGTTSSEGGGTSSSGAGSSGSASSSGTSSSSGSASSSGGASSSGSASSSGGTSSSGASSSGSSGDGGQDGTVSDGSGGDSTTPDAPTDVGPDTTPPPDTGGGCTSATGCYTIPVGWTFVAVAGDLAAACPSGYNNPSDLFESPDATNACACGTCQMQGQPTCENGPINIKYDVKGTFGAGQCGQAGQPPSNDNAPPGNCGTDMYNGGGVLPYSSIDLQFQPPPVTGQCTSSGTEEAANVTYGAQDRECQTNGAASGCTGNQCMPTFTSPFQACIIKSGMQTCPATSPFTQQHVAGSNVSYTCSDCGCNVSASCSGTMNLYTDDSCKDNQTQLPVDGQCHGASGNSFNSYKYTANAPANLGCASTGSSSPQNLQLTGQQTICCVP